VNIIGNNNERALPGRGKKKEGKGGMGNGRVAAFAVDPTGHSFFYLINSVVPTPPQHPLAHLSCMTPSLLSGLSMLFPSMVAPILPAPITHFFQYKY